MSDKAHIRLVDTHTKRHGRRYDVHVPAHEPALHILQGAPRQPRVVACGAEPGDVLAFESANPTRVSIQPFVGQDINRLTFRLVDQHNDSVSDLAGEHFSAVVLMSYD